MASTRTLMIGAICAVGMLAGCDDGTDAASDTATPDAVGADGGPMPDEGVDPDGAAPDPEAAIAALVGAVDLTRYSADLEAVSRGPRPSPDGANWQAAQDLCAEVFVASGFEVVRQPFHSGGVNVIGVLPGTTRPDEHLVLGAHYDSEFACNGADDNGTGVAGVLEAARVLGSRRFERTVVVACFDAEEYALAGSIDYARRARDRGDDIRGALILEMIGYTDDTPGSQRLPGGIEFIFPAAARAVADRDSRGDFLFYIGDDTAEMVGHVQTAAEAAGIPLIGVQLDQALRESDLSVQFRRSDHAPLWAAGYPAMMLTDSAEFRNPNYHCNFGEDDIDTIDLEFALSTTRTAVGAIARAAVPADGEPVAGREVDAEPPRNGAGLLCDPISGQCDDGQRCTLVVSGQIELACRPHADEPLELDAPCVRDANGGDTCADGLFCTLTGRDINAERRCRPLCRSTADCPGDSVCPTFGIGVGNCIETCDLFGDDCPPTTGCAINGDADDRAEVIFCRQAGPAGEGEDCSNADCRPGLTCDSTFSLGAGLGCVAYCRPSAPDCTEGRTCVPFRRRGLPDDIGHCLPDDRL